MRGKPGFVVPRRDAGVGVVQAVVGGHGRLVGGLVGTLGASIDYLENRRKALGEACWRSQTPPQGDGAYQSDHQELRELIAATRVLVVEDETSRHYSGIRAALKKAGRPIPPNDLWIAALCRQHRLPLLSQDQHFDAVEGLERVGWLLKSLRSVSKWICFRIH
jgi:PIN domain